MSRESSGAVVDLRAYRDERGPSRSSPRTRFLDVDVAHYLDEMRDAHAQQFETQLERLQTQLQALGLSHPSVLPPQAAAASPTTPEERPHGLRAWFRTYPRYTVLTHTGLVVLLTIAEVLLGKLFQRDILAPDVALVLLLLAGTFFAMAVSASDSVS